MRSARGHVGKVTRDTGKDKVAVQRFNCGGAACKSAKVEAIVSGGGWQPRVAGGGHGYSLRGEPETG